MTTIRLFEESICEFIENSQIKTPCHLYIGQEAIATGVCSNLRDEDLIWGNHRSHGHYIAKGGNLQSLMDEIFCKKTGCSEGRGGSMHILDRQKGVLGTVPIVAATLPLAVGAGLSFKLSKEDLISVSFIGDGATEEGHVLEAMNMAALYKIPTLFVIENNFYSSHMHVIERRKQTDLQEIGKMLGISTCKVDGNDVRLVQEVAANSISNIRNGKGPEIIEFMTYRWRGHVGASFDEDVGVKRKDELSEWLKKDPILVEKNKLYEEGVNKHELDQINKKIKLKIESIIKKALEAPFPDQKTLLRNVFVTDN